MTDVAGWLESIGLGQYAELFAENAIDLEVLPHLSDQDLRELGLPLGHRKKVLVTVEALSGEQPPAIDAGSTPEALIGESQRPEAERGQLTVMFCDLVGSTALSQKLDAEDFREAMRAFHKACRPVPSRDVNERLRGHPQGTSAVRLNSGSSATPT